jgi:hypothetical protein
MHLPLEAEAQMVITYNKSLAFFISHQFAWLLDNQIHCHLPSLLFLLKGTRWTTAMTCFWASFASTSECISFWACCPAECFQLMWPSVQIGVILYENLHKYVLCMTCHIIWHSLGTAERTVSKSWRLHTVVHSGRASISRTSLMVNATCNGPRRPIIFTRRTLLCDSASRACSVISVLCKNHI